MLLMINMHDMDKYGWDKNIEEYNPNKKQKISVVYDDTIADILGNKNLWYENSKQARASTNCI